MTDIISQTFRRLKNRYESIGDKIGSCPYPVKVFLLVSSAQGVIDNGGYRYFFGSDWPGNLPYCEFVEAYRAIGCEKQANELERVIETFPFDNPHYYEEKRKEYMINSFDDDRCEVRGWGDELCRDEEVWKMLALYCKEHKKELL